MLIIFTYLLRIRVGIHLVLVVQVSKLNFYLRSENPIMILHC